MSLKKNQIFETTIENLPAMAAALLMWKGRPFCPARHRDVIRCRIVKALKAMLSAALTRF